VMRWGMWTVSKLVTATSELSKKPIAAAFY